MLSDVLALCYHAVSEDWPDAMSVHPDRLERQMSRLLERGYVATTFTRAVTEPPAPRTLAVTFDDACRSVVERGLPILDRLGIPATLFVPTDYVGAREPMDWPELAQWLSTDHRSELLPVDWDDIRALHGAGWEIGSHTCSHPHLPELDAQRLAEELSRSRAEIERRLGVRCTSLAYPFGECDSRVAAAARAARYRTAAALLPSRIGRPRALMWPRVMVGYGDSDARFARQVHPATRAAQSWRVWPLVERAVPAVKRFRLIGAPPVAAPPLSGDGPAPAARSLSKGRT